MAKKQPPVTWEPRKVKLSDLKDNPDNPKILNDKGRNRLQKLLSKFGLAGTLIANTDNTIIDGHSRKKELLDEGITVAWVSYPSRLLTEKEYKELNALFDTAKSGEPDMLMMEEILSEETMIEYELASDKNKKQVQEIELKPFNKTHILLSFPPEKMVKIQEYLQKITEFEFVEYEQGNN